MTKFYFCYISSGFFDLVQYWRLSQIRYFYIQLSKRLCTCYCCRNMVCWRSGWSSWARSKQVDFRLRIITMPGLGGGAKKWRGNEEEWKQVWSLWFLIVRVLTVNTRTVTKSTLWGGSKQDKWCVNVSTLWRCEWIWKAREKMVEIDLCDGWAPWPHLGATHRQTGRGLHQRRWSNDACATPQRQPRHELAWIGTDFLS